MSRYPRIVIIDISEIRFPTGSDEEMVFQTFRSYPGGLLHLVARPAPARGRAGARRRGRREGARPWAVSVPRESKELTERAWELLRNAWATEVLLNAPRIFGSRDLNGFANL